MNGAVALAVVLTLMVGTVVFLGTVTRTELDHHDPDVVAVPTAVLAWLVDV